LTCGRAVCSVKGNKEARRRRTHARRCQPLYQAEPHLEPGRDSVARRRRAAPADHKVVVVGVVPRLRRCHHLLRAAKHGYTARVTPRSGRVERRR
jgi:hypothetical protein